ncbi:hypothetical protein BC833DRAFT_64505 [Globomyces pollinis-pini]|nr:hypothetical protein BC833DRAFT_64505 [Globomyces pollinis-pini]
MKCNENQPKSENRKQDWADELYMKTKDELSKRLKVITTIKQLQETLELNKLLQYQINTKMIEMEYKPVNAFNQNNDVPIIKLINRKPYFIQFHRSKCISIPPQNQTRNLNGQSKMDIILKSGEWTKESLLKLKKETCRLKSLYPTLSDAELPWDRISRHFVNRSADECLEQWKKLPENIDQYHVFSDTELKELRKVIDEHHTLDWNAIAVDHGHDRTAIECFTTYKRHLQPSNSAWTSNQDEQLKRLHQVYGNDWASISSWIDKKSAKQCYNRIVTLGTGTEVKKGVWNSFEDTELLSRVEDIGKNWNKIQTYFPNRTAKQCRDRYEKHLNPCLRKDEFDVTELGLLSELVEKFGENNWIKIVENIPNRTSYQVCITFR